MRRVLMDNRRHGWQEAIANDLRGETGAALSPLPEGMEKNRLTRRFELLHRIGEAKVRYRRISVRQEHIDEGRQADCRECPIALAIYEEFFHEDAPPPSVRVGKDQGVGISAPLLQEYEVTWCLVDIIDRYDHGDVDAMAPMELMLLVTDAGGPRPGCDGWLT